MLVTIIIIKVGGLIHETITELCVWALPFALLHPHCPTADCRYQNVYAQPKTGRGSKSYVGECQGLTKANSIHKTPHIYTWFVWKRRLKTHKDRQCRPFRLCLNRRWWSIYNTIFGLELHRKPPHTHTLFWGKSQYSLMFPHAQSEYIRVK